MPEFQLKPKLIKAGAGTGKTTELVNEVYSLFKKSISADGKIPKLIVCTFTRKASQELKERLFKKAVKEFSETEKPTLKQTNFTKEKNKVLEASPSFLNYMQSSSLYISTIDGILNMFLKKYGHRFDLSPDFQLNDSQSSETLFDSLAEEFIFEKNFSLLKKIPYPFLKTLFIFYFKSRLKYGEVSFYNRKDFEEFNQDKRLFEQIKDSFKKTKNKKFDTTEIKDFFKKYQSPLAGFINECEDVDTMKDLFKEDKSFQADEFISLFEEFHKAGKEFFLSFIETKKNKAVLDIDDLLLFSLALLKENPKTAKDFSKEWDYWLIDEYQDTSWVQEQIIKEITKFNNVFCVGDPAQSIYLFRGADPNVFKRREEALGNDVVKLNINRRASSELVYFYNDFFPESKGFMKVKPINDKQISINKPSVYFFTYEKSKDQKAESRQQALKALSHYIQKLVAEGSCYKDIAVLSSKNDDLVEIAAYLRSQNLPLMLYNSKGFVQKRLVMDALFLLKFLINPYDNTNLKALLRTPYFRMSDQELADSSFDHYELRKGQEPVSFWSFILNNFPDKRFVQSLRSYLELKKEQGLVRSFEKALMDSGFMDLSYIQDRTGSSESNLWKLLYLLNRGSSSAGQLFYSLMSEENAEDNNKEAPSCEDSDSIELMTIHKSKGLEFKHVILMDFSIDQSALSKSGNKAKEVIYDEKRGKMAFAVPIEGRDKTKIKSYGHRMNIENKKKEQLLEQERVFYVAMTRAKQSLALFIPNVPPVKNSWLSRVHFFDNFPTQESDQILLEKQYDEKKKEKLISWKLNEGFYKTNNYSFYVKSTEAVCSAPHEFIGCPDQLNNIKREEQTKEPAVLTGEENYFKTGFELQIKSSGDFVNDVMGHDFINKSAETDKDLSAVQETKRPDKTPNEKFTSHKESKVLDENCRKQETKNRFYLSKTKNLLLKKNLGNHLHFFLQKLSYQSIEQIQPLIEKSFLSQKEKEQIKQALVYITQLEEPDMNCFLKTGFSEWPFQYQKQNILLQGQIDLWAWDSNEIHLLDYKSSMSQSSQAKKQLIFYSWILDEFYHPKNIWMYELYPLQQTFKKRLYNNSYKAIVSSWVKKVRLQNAKIM